MSRETIARTLLGVSILGTVAIVAAADVFNATHLFNPDWPAHARFHIAMQFTTLLLVSAVSLGGLIGPFSMGGALRAALAPLTFWPGLFVAWAVPGTDPYASEALRAVGAPINIVLAGLFIALTLGALLLARTEIAAQLRVRPGR